jgi:anti-sigma28 factor (negative regulator of flagellin synthesis)
MSDTNNPNPPRKRGLTSLTIQWLAEKFRRAEKIKEELSQGTYQVDSDKVAKAIIDNNSLGSNSNQPH